MRSSTLLSLLPLCILSVQGQSTAEYAETFVNHRLTAPSARVPQVANRPPGPILDTGKYDVISSKLLKGSDMPQFRRAPVKLSMDAQPSDHSPVLQRVQLQSLQPEHQQPLYRYDGPLDGRRVWIYKKILQPVRITSHGMERLPGAQVIDQWAEGGYGNQLTSSMRAPVYTPTSTNGLFTQTLGQFVHA